MVKEFRLVLSARVFSGWSGGWAAGSINAHYFHYRKNQKVFWFQYFAKKGFGKYKDVIDENWDDIRKNLGKPRDKTFVSNIGYFYESGTSSITWQFKLEKIVKQDEISEGEKKYIPAFRQVYYDNPEEFKGNTYWLLLSDLKKFRRPVNCNSRSGFKFLDQDGKLNPLNPQRHLLMNCFVSVFPKIKVNNLYKPSEKELQDLHLKELLIKGLTDKRARFHESYVQDAILIDLLSKGYVFSKEGFVEEKDTGSKGRYDFLIKKGDMYYAIETKVDDEITAAEQLEEYIDKIVKKGEIPRSKIKGIIICGRASKETKSEAQARRFKVYEYKLDINVPSIIEDL